MKIDRASIMRMLALDDRQLKMIIERVAAGAGVDIPAESLTPQALAALRTAVERADDSELEGIAQSFAGRTPNDRG